MKRDLVVFYIYRIVSRLYFHLPVLFFHFYRVDMGLGRIIVLLAVYGLITTVTANLSSRLHHRLSLKQMVALGEILKAIGLALVILGTRIGGTEFWTVMAGQVIGGTGFSLAISADGSLLRTITQASGNELFNQIQSRSQSRMFIATLVAGCVGSILYDYEAHWPFYASLGATIAASAAILFIKAEEAPVVAGAMAKTDGLAAIGLDGSQRFWMNFYSISRAYTLGPFVGFLPFYFIQLQVDPFLFGSVLGLFSVGAFLAALYANTFLKYFGLPALMVATVASMLGSMLLFGFSEWLSVRGIDYFVTGLVAVALLGVGSGGVRPLTMANINLGRLKAEHRPRVLSRMERNFGVFNGVLLAAGGALLERNGFSAVMLCLALSYLSMMALLQVSRKQETEEWMSSRP